MKKIILGSASPRRKELLSQIGVPFEVRVSNKEEVYTNTVPKEIVKELALMKAENVASEIPARNVIVIGADTIVVLERQILGKPKDEEEAKAMLSRLSGKTHQVMTGVCLLSADQRVCFCDVSDVEFYPLTAEEIDAYVATGEPLDKAGAYGIQGEGFFLAKKITGDFYSIMGFPVARVLRALKKFDF